MIVCEICNGEGCVGIEVPICCEQPLRTGECCCRPVASLEIEACNMCGGIGHYPDERMEREP